MEELKEEYADSFTLSKGELEIYDIPATLDEVLEKLRELKIARNRYINGYHVRVTVNYIPRLEGFSNSIANPVANAVEFKLDSEKAYNEFNIQLNKLYEIMSKKEIAYINDCLICNKSETSVRDKFGICKDNFNTIKSSAVVRFALAFNIVVYK